MEVVALKTYKISTTIEVTKNNISRTLFNDACLEMKQGEMIILKAPNGSGKTTFIKTLLGSMGQNTIRKSNTKNENIKFNNSNIDIQEYDDLSDIKNKLNQVTMAQRISYMKQSFPDYLIKGTIEDFIKENLRGAVEDRKIKELFNSEWFLSLIDNLIKLFYFEKDFNYQKYTKKDLIKYMSGGEMQALLFIATILRALYTDIVILDEPFNNVGFSQKRMINDIIRKLHDDFPDKIFLIISHCTIINLDLYINSKSLTVNSNTGKFEESDYNNYSCLGTSTKIYFDYEEYIVKHKLMFGAFKL